ncbi:MAG: glycosyltransferase family 4 protein [Chitinophaga sp.]|uniref:glycosyltransferase family 4 protein n=1 Tax=Chitinophaga sp. TaxID=1869181 RepID=UPI001B0D501F|nr:glycosyltransferase family 4 protein [Chitinophaga sp.]MBO9732385.1 glycosyltransferase family 4 protein [Chitinophaga sp.]
MKICFITLGDIKFIATMKRAIGMADPLLAMGWEVAIIVQDSEENRKRIAMECSEAVKIYYYPEGTAAEEVRAKTALVNQIAPDYILFCSFSFRNRILKNKLKLKPTILIEHSELPSGIPDNRGLRKIAMLALEYWSVLYADGLLCASRYLCKTYAKRAAQLFRKQLPVLYSPYAFNQEVMESPRIRFKELEETYRGQTLLIYMGTMTRNYGLFTMLQAMEMISMERKDVTLLLLGQGRHLAEAKDFVKEKKLDSQVQFLGYTAEEELSSYFAAATAFISPLNDTVQDWARCPSKIYMYIPFNKPVFTCRIGEPLEIFGEQGYYFDNTAPSSLAALISRLAAGKLAPAALDKSAHSWTKRAADLTEWAGNHYDAKVLHIANLKMKAL